jgi:1L-myo-inositol 1-phosphate cytidylyltransferase
MAAVSGDMPKPLVPLHGRPLLEHVMLGVREAGISRFVIVTGYRGDRIRNWYESNRIPGVHVEWVQNPDYHKANGISVLKAKSVISESFLLLMADHVFEPDTARRLLREPIAQDEVILAVDHNIDHIFDIDDATKVRLDGDRIVEIGKNIATYNAADTGMFRCNPVLFDWLESSMKNGDCSLSDGMRKLAQNRKLRAFDIGDAMWQDADTPEALNYAAKLFSYAAV